MRKRPFPRCEVCSAKAPGGVCRLQEGVAGRFAGNRISHVYERGQAIFHEGWPAESLFILHSGRVRVFRTWRNGEEQVLRLLGPGEILGYRPLFAGEIYGASAQAIEDSTVCVIPKSVVLERLRQDPELALQLLDKLSRELRISEDLMMDLVRRPVRERAARLLIGLVESSQATSEPGAILSRQVPRKDLARMIGTTPETFSRVLGDFARRGIVQLTRERIVVRDERLLRRAAGERDPR